MSLTTLLLIAGVYIAGTVLVCGFVAVGAANDRPCTWRCQPRRRMTLAEQNWRMN
jgi:hypothetical protein